MGWDLCNRYIVMWNVSQTLSSQISHTSLSRTSYGLSIMGILEHIDLVRPGPQYKYKRQWMVSYNEVQVLWVPVSTVFIPRWVMWRKWPDGIHADTRPFHKYAMSSQLKRCKILFILVSFPIVLACQKCAYVMRTQLSWHMQNIDSIGSLVFREKSLCVSARFELWARILIWLTLSSPQTFTFNAKYIYLHSGLMTTGIWVPLLPREFD